MGGAWGNNEDVARRTPLSVVSASFAQALAEMCLRVHCLARVSRHNVLATHSLSCLGAVAAAAAAAAAFGPM